MKILISTLGFMALAAGSQAGEARPPNVLFIAVDDMNDWIGCLGGYAGKVHTPNMDRLAERGVLFTNAHCPSPKCAPSRAAVMTGLMPSTSGVYDNNQWWYPNLLDRVTLTAHFRSHGYRVCGAGKIFHHTAGNQPPNQWDEFLPIRFRNDPWFRGRKDNYPWSETAAHPPGFPFSGVAGLGHENDWGSLGIPEADYDDSLSVDFVLDQLERPDPRPWFLACGLFRPHLPWYAPQKYFDLYPLDEIVLPEVPEDDLDDVPAGGRALAASRRKDLQKIVKADKWREAARAYLACISFADFQIGRLLEGLDASGVQDQTLIVLWSDHGWHLGEKQHWHKSTLWEEATRVPLIVTGPGIEPGRCSRPVSLIDLYPTLVDLCDQPEVPGLDGVSLVPLLENPDAEWDRPAVIEYHTGNVAVRTEHHRFVRYREGGEELYDHRDDPNEWTNLAPQPGSSRTCAEMGGWLPETWAKPAKTKSAYVFDPDRFTWTEHESQRVISGAEPPNQP